MQKMPYQTATTNRQQPSHRATNRATDLRSETHLQGVSLVNCTTRNHDNALRACARPRRPAPRPAGNAHTAGHSCGRPDNYPMGSCAEFFPWQGVFPRAGLAARARARSRWPGRECLPGHNSCLPQHWKSLYRAYGRAIRGPRGPR